MGRPDTGIVATNDKAAILALDADVVLHSASKAYGFDANTDDIVALLETGKSVITVTSYAHLPTLGADVSERIRKACAVGNSRFSSTLPSWPTDWCTRPSLGGRVRQRRWFARGRGRAPRFMTRKASTSGTVHQDPSRRESGPPGRALIPTGAPWCRPRRVAVAARPFVKTSDSVSSAERVAHGAARHCSQGLSVRCPNGEVHGNDRKRPTKSQPLPSSRNHHKTTLNKTR